MPILRMLIDAAMLYSAALCSSLIHFALSNNGLYRGNFAVSICYRKSLNQCTVDSSSSEIHQVKSYDNGLKLRALGAEIAVFYSEILLCKDTAEFVLE
jgi:hypothetical protein